MQRVVRMLTEEVCDPDYGIIPVYTYNKENADTVIAMTDDEYKAAMTE